MKTLVLAALLSGVMANSALAYAPAVPTLAERLASAPSLWFPPIKASPAITSEALLDGMGGVSAFLPADIRRRVDTLDASCSDLGARGSSPAYCLGYRTQLAASVPAPGR